MEIIKNPNAQALGSLGGKKAAENMTPEQRKARAIRAVWQRELNRTIQKLKTEQV